MNLIDASAWIEYYRNNGNENYKRDIIRNLKDNLAATCGIIKTELLVHTCVSVVNCFKENHEDTKEKLI